MEALTAALAAALTVYDMTKGLDPSIEIVAAHLLEKDGGKSGHWRRRRVRAAVLTVSDGVAAGTREDASGDRAGRARRRAPASRWWSASSCPTTGRRSPRRCGA